MPFHGGSREPPVAVAVNVAVCVASIVVALGFVAMTGGELMTTFAEAAGGYVNLSGYGRVAPDCTGGERHRGRSVCARIVGWAPESEPRFVPNVTGRPMRVTRFASDTVVPAEFFVKSAVSVVDVGAWFAKTASGLAEIVRSRRGLALTAPPVVVTLSGAGGPWIGVARPTNCWLRPRCLR